MVRRSDGFALAALLCGIFFWPLAFVFGPMSLSRLRKNPGLTGSGMAITGIVLGAFGALITVLLMTGILTVRVIHAKP